MRLIECSIAGFGAFSDYRITFDEGLNVILQPNGWGKTTLAAFVKAMLYGFGRKRVRDVSENERLRYLPWEGKSYGGSLDFEFDGRAYRVVRKFGKTAAGDTLVVIDIDSGQKVDVGDGEVGEWLFGLDSNAFQKSVFVGQNGFGFDGSTSGLRSRLNALVNEADDVAGLDKALSRLDERRRHYKKTGGRGAIADASAMVNALAERQNELDRKVGEVSNLQAEMTLLDSQVREADKKISHATASLEKVRGIEGDLKALSEAHDLLVTGSANARAAYDAFLDGGVAIPTEDDVAELRKLMETESELMDEVEKVEVRARAAGLAADNIRRHYGGKLPAKYPDEVEEKKREVSELAHQMKVIELARPADSERFAAADEAVSADPGLLTRVDEALLRWPEVKAELASRDDARRELDAANAVWASSLANVRRLEAEARQARDEVPVDVQKRLGALDKAGSELRECARLNEALDVKLAALDEQIAVAEEGLVGAPDSAGDIETSIARIDEGVEACGKADSAVASTREAFDDASAELDQLRRLADVASARGQEAQTALEKASERAAALESVAVSQAAMSTEASPKAVGRSSVFAGCLVSAVFAIVAGFLLGVGTVASLVAFGLAAALVVVGFVARSSNDKRADVTCESGTVHASVAQSPEAKDAARAVEDAKTALSDARAAQSAAAEKTACQQETVDAARRAFEDAKASEVLAKEALTATLAGLIGAEDVSAADILTRAVSTRERLAASIEGVSRLSGLRARRAFLEGERSDLSVRVKDALASASFDGCGDISRDADSLSSSATELRSRIARAEEAEGRLQVAQAEALGRTGEPLRETDLVLLGSDEAPSAAKLSARIRAAEKSSSDYEAVLAPLCTAFGFDTVADITSQVERLSVTLDAYRAYRSEAEESKDELSAARSRVAELESDLLAWARQAGLSGLDDLTSERLDSISRDVEFALDQDSLKARLLLRLTKLKSSLSENEEKINAVLDHFGVSLDERERAADVLAERSRRFADLTRDLSSADERLAAWEAQNGEKLQGAKDAAAEGDGVAARAVLDSARKTRESLVEERSRCEERRDALLRELECWPSVAQETRLVSRQKQDAVARLFTVQTTAGLLERARDNLDRRYYGALAERFNDYVGSLLKDEGLGVDITGDFDVTVSKNGSPHGVAAYSTGYQDLLDVCMRMALVDTIFEGEQPFIVMDDPFVNLDQDKVAKALRLLVRLSRDRQVVYFCCHPSRMGAAETDDIVEFALPEQRASRELPRARARREAQERARAQAELVASYHVVPVTWGRASIRVARTRRIVSSNLVNVSFEVDPDAGVGNNAFEVHFIDGRGRALCERQTVEVVDGRVVPTRVQFSLTTHEDSGDVLDLIIHEQDRQSAELAGRISFRSQIAFANQDFGF